MEQTLLKERFNSDTLSYITETRNGKKIYKFRGVFQEANDIKNNKNRKLQQKQLDLIAANDVTSADSGFGTDTNKVTLIDRDGKEESLPLMKYPREISDIRSSSKDFAQESLRTHPILLELKPFRNLGGA